MNEPVSEYLLQQLNEGDIIVVCPHLEMATYPHRKALEFLKEQGLLESSTKRTLEVNNGRRIEFVPDKEELLRGRRECAIVNLDTFEKMLSKEKEQLENAQKVHGGF